MILRPIVLLVLLTSLAWAQDTAPASPSPLAAPASQNEAGAPSQAGASPSPTSSPDVLAQMRLDLDHMDSLLNNMSSEITFLHDQNLQILLNTNARMWTLLLRDLRRQLKLEEEERRSHVSPDGNPAATHTNPPATRNKPK